jgi:hypothetical protein
MEYRPFDADRDLDAVVALYGGEGRPSLAEHARARRALTAPGDRPHGIGRELVARLLAASGVARMDLLAEPGVTGFYEAFPHKRKPGFRIYPDERS